MVRLGVLCCLVVLADFASAGICELSLGDDSCVWFEYNIEDGMDFRTAAEKCSSRGGRAVQIKDEAEYNAIIHFLRSKIPNYMDTILAWTGVEIDAMTGIITKPDRDEEEVYIKWTTDGRAIGAEYDGWTNIYLQASNAEGNEEGMENFSPLGRIDGIVCEVVS